MDSMKKISEYSLHGLREIIKFVRTSQREIPPSYKLHG